TRSAAGRIGDSTAAFGRSVGDRSQDFMAFCKEQPLVLVGLGVALGAAIGATLPRSDTEDELMGETSDEIKDRMRQVTDKAKDKAQSSLDEIKQEFQSPSGQPPTDGEAARAANENGGGANAPMAESASSTGSPASSDPAQMAQNESDRPQGATTAQE